MIPMPSKKLYLAIMSILLVSGCASKTGLRDKDLQVEKSLLNKRHEQVVTASQKQQVEEQGRQFKEVNVEDWGGITRLKEEAKSAPKLEGPAITFSADEMPVKEFANKVFQELLGINYVISPKLSTSRDTVTLNLSSSIDRTEFYRVAMKALEESGVTSFRKDEILYLSKSSGAEQKNSIAVGIGNKVNDIPEVAGAITHIVPYIYSSSRNITNILSKLSTAKVTVNSLQKLIILEGERAELVRAIKIINMLDVPRAFGREIRLFEFAHISPTEGIEQIKALLEEDGLSVSKEGDVSFVPLPRINSFVAYAASQDTIERISFWAKKIDVPLAGDERQYFIYKPKYAKAEDMRESLDVLLRGRTSGGSEDTASKGAVNKSAENVKFSLDKQQNALIFYTTKDEYRLVESLLKKMDVLPGQVILDITILEITLNDEMSSGIKWLYNQAGSSGSDRLTLDPGTGTLFGQVISGDWKAEFNWKDSLDDARVLSRPYFIVRDGESATLSSGDQIPIITQTVENLGNNSSVSNSVQYRSTGINVSITPIINSQGVVTLSVSMSVSDGKPNTLGGVSSPTITNRSISTEVLSGDGQTVALGGLIQEKKNDYTQGVPALGELPILGNLFKAKVDSLQRTELMMLITTKVVKSESEVDEFGEAMSELYSVPIVIK
ncbi:secretin N-terminal domain-containing protein [Pseudoalteromonas piscicida]|uniref:secretin N-terminal domain-containing protein n=1 Tax=Pseudoalteromonas piscicida TaxID=43662 RepID=UPI001EFD88FD|nr:secretin N-terminal domain-containing protein [Pseudoalteromonas piscicida]